MVKDGSVKVRQSVAGRALKPSVSAIVSRNLRVMVGGMPYRSAEGAGLFNRHALTCKPQRMFGSVRGEQHLLLPGILCEIERKLQVIQLGKVMRRRGVPRRGGRSGVRAAREEEEPHPIAPMAASYPSSTSSDEEFLFGQNSYQSFRLRIPGRDLQTDVIVNLSVYLTEAPPIEPAGSSLASAVAGLLDSEILLGDMDGTVHRMARPLAAAIPVIPPPPAPDLEDNLRDVSVQEILPLRDRDQYRNEGQGSVHPDSDDQQQDVEDSVIWLDPPSNVERTSPEAPSRPI